jgi:hypothetical protein
MTQFKYTSDETRVYPVLAREVSKGDVVTADENPDPDRFASVKTPKEKS